MAKTLHGFVPWATDWEVTAAFPEGAYILVYLDSYNLSKGRGRTELRRPFDPRMGAWMEHLLEHFMIQERYKAIFGYTISDELYFVLGPSCRAYGRRPNYFYSIIASECTLEFEKLSGLGVTWEVGLCVRDSAEDVVEALLDRRASTVYSLVDNHCYYYHRAAGFEGADAHKRVQQMSHVEKLEWMADFLETRERLEQARSTRATTDGDPSYAEYEAVLGRESLGCISFFSSNGQLPKGVNARKVEDVSGLVVIDHLEYDRSAEHILKPIVSDAIHSSSAARGSPPPLPPRNQTVVVKPPSSPHSVVRRPAGTTPLAPKRRLRFY